MEIAKAQDIGEIYELYKTVIDTVNTTDIRLGWNMEVYPNYDFVCSSVEKGEMVILREDNAIVGVAVVNHNVNQEYDDIDWLIKAPKDKISTIHALATLPSHRNSKASYKMLNEIEAMCKAKGDLAIHLDVIDTNIPAYKLYTRNGYNMIEQIKMYYEVVGIREFWMLEKIL